MSLIADYGLVLLVLACLFGFFMAWGVGANDVANAMGTSVGSRALTIKQAIIIAMIFEFAGAYLAIAQSAAFIKDMSAGKGYIALAALIFAKWRPWGALWACMLFGFFQALALRPDVVQAVVQVMVPVPFLDALPYVLTVLVLAGFVGKAIPPRAGGEPYVKER